MSVDYGDRAVRFINRLTHTKGKWARQPFRLRPWQEPIVRKLFGTVNDDGLRQYRTSFVFFPRKNGKTELAASIALYSLLSAPEAGGEIYSAACDREQASLVFNVASQMIRNDWELCQKCKITDSHRKIVYGPTNSVYRAIPADAPHAHGFNASVVIADEVHAWRNRDLWDVLTTSFGAREQPLTVAITTAGYDRNSLCYQLYDYATKVRDGIIDDPTFLPVIYEAVNCEHTEFFQSVDAIKRLDKMCSCEHVPITLIENLLDEICARHAIQDGGRRTGQITGKDAKGILIDGSGRAICAPHVMSNGALTKTQDTKQRRSRNELNGLGETQIESRHRILDGETSRHQNNILPTIAECEVTESLASNIAAYSLSKNSDAQYAARNARLSSIIATFQKRLEAYSANDAILASVYSEILRSVYDRHSDTCNVRRNAKVDHERLIVQCPPDDWTDEATWRKANPALGDFRSIDEMRSFFREAREVPARETVFRQLYLNQWVDSAVRWISSDAWNGCEEVFDEDDLRGQECYAALDLAYRDDVAALVLLFPHDGETFRMLCYFWIPECGKRDRTRPPMSQWIKNGFVTTTPGNSTEFGAIRKKINEIQNQFFIRKLAVDPWNARQLSSELITDGIDVVDFPQTMKNFTEPTKEFESLIKAKKIRHNGNPVMTWMMSNVMVETDSSGNYRPSKKKSTEKIDGAVAAIMALAVAGPAFRASIYETREMIVL